MEIEDRDLIGVEYPGRVENIDNMVKTLGGLNNISKVVIDLSIYKTESKNLINVLWYCKIRYAIWIKSV